MRNTYEQRLETALEILHKELAQGAEWPDVTYTICRQQDVTYSDLCEAYDEAALHQWENNRGEPDDMQTLLDDAQHQLRNYNK